MNYTERRLTVLDPVEWLHNLPEQILRHLHNLANWLLRKVSPARLLTKIS